MGLIIPGQNGGGISNGYVIEGVAHITSTTAPATRPNGSALVAGDMWLKPVDNGVEATAGLWIWRSPYWVSSFVKTMGITAQSPVASTIRAEQIFYCNTRVLVWAESVTISGRLNAPADGSNTATISFATSGFPVAVPAVTFNSTTAITQTTVANGTWNLNVDTKFFFNRTGTPGSFNQCRCVVSFREIHP